jgi:Phytanoyl-CoA dioxygenase (PhyH)
MAVVGITDTLSVAEVENYHRDGFLFVDRPLLARTDVVEARRLTDELVAVWAQLPRRLAPEVGGDPRGVLEIMNAMALEPGLRHLGLVRDCQALACRVLGVRRTWCLFDHVIYKRAGGPAVGWHQDVVASRTGLFEQAVHFWIPLHDLTPECGRMMFVPGSHNCDLRRHEPYGGVGGIQKRVVLSDEEVVVAKTLPLGGFSIHTPRTLHSSAANEGADVRKAWILQFGAGLPAAARDLSRRHLPGALSRRLAM